jgi:hypothetical protein
MKKKYLVLWSLFLIVVSSIGGALVTANIFSKNINDLVVSGASAEIALDLAKRDYIEEKKNDKAIKLLDTMISSNLVVLQYTSSKNLKINSLVKETLMQNKEYIYSLPDKKVNISKSSIDLIYKKYLNAPNKSLQQNF